MSSTAVDNASRSGLTDSRSRNTAKGRRRRAAAEQRRIDQHRWGQHLGTVDDEEEDFVLNIANPVQRRRPSRRSSRRSSARDVNSDLEDDCLQTNHAYAEDLETAVALSLSLGNSGSRVPRDVPGLTDSLDMSYESLIQLEDVKCVTGLSTVDSFVAFAFLKSASSCSTVEAEECCVICQNEYSGGEHLIRLPCTHQFHHVCGSEWLLNYSKLCPVCKIDVTSRPQ